MSPRGREKERKRNGNPTVLSHATVRQVARPAKESHTNNWSKELCKPVGGRLSLRAAAARFSVERTPPRATTRFSARTTRKDRRERRRTAAIVEKYVWRSGEKKKDKKKEISRQHDGDVGLARLMFLSLSPARSNIR